MKVFRDLAGRLVPAGHKLAPLLTEFQPSIVLLKSSIRKTLRRKPHLEDILDTVRRESEDRIAVRLISPQRIRSVSPGSVRHKDILASRVAVRFPDLAWKLPPRRKFPRREHYRMSIFDAGAFGLAYYGPRENEDQSHPAPS